MILFLKGMLIGIGKIIPGVSGSLLAINFGIYENFIESITNFFSNWKKNTKFLLTIGTGIIISIVIGSKLINYILINYYFLTMMLFLGLIIGGTYNFSKNIIYKKYDLITISIIIIIILLLSINNNNHIYYLKGNIIDDIVFFFGGIIEAFTSVIPGISGTAIEMILGIYNNIIELFSSILNIQYVIDNINLYLSFGLGLFISFIISILLVHICLKKYKRISNIIIFSLSISSIIILLKLTFSTKIIFIELIIGLMLLVLGLLISSILDK